LFITDIDRKFVVRINILFQQVFMSNKTSKYILIAITTFILFLLSCDRQDRITNSDLFNTTWKKTIVGLGEGQGNSIISMPDSGYMVTGYIYPVGIKSSDICLIRLNESGDTVWTRTYGGNSHDMGYSISRTPDGAYIITGESPFFGGGSTNLFVLKVNLSGDIIWHKTYGGNGSEGGHSIVALPDGNFIISGITSSYGGHSNIYFLKINQSGDTLWCKVLGNEKDNFDFAAVSEINNEFYIAGSLFRSTPYGLSNDIFIFKTNSDGDTVFTKYFGGTGYEKGYSVVATPDGGCIVAGLTQSYGAGKNDIYLIRVDSLGNPTWIKTYGNEGDDRALSIITATDGNYIVAGYTESYAGADKDFLLMKIDVDGNPIWIRSIGERYTSELANSVTQAIDGGYVLTGFRYYAGDQYIYIVKTDPYGNL
jgi:hypothetical protein